MRQSDPTRTKTLRLRAVRELNKRFSQLKKLIILSLKNSNIKRFNVEEFKDNEFSYTTKEEYYTAFLKWLDEAINEIIFENTTEADKLWLNTYLKQAYIRGLKVTDASVRTQLEIISPTISGVASTEIGLGLSLSTENRLLIPQHVERTTYLYSRTYENLKNVTSTMASSIKKELVEGMFAGDNPNIIAKNINDRVDKIGLTRSKLIARTEIVNSYQKAVITEGSVLSEQLSVQDKYKWTTSTDDRVRNTHEDRHNKIFEREKVEKLVGEPNCRCRIFLVLDEGDN